MKKGSIRIYISQLAILSVLSAGWWGMLYPEFSLSEDTFSVALEQKKTEKTSDSKDMFAEKMSGSEAFWALLEAKPDEIKIKSKFLDDVFDMMDRDIRGKEDEQQCTHRDF